MQDNHYLVPAQLHGNEKNIAYNIDVKTVEDAEDWFVDAKERLLDVNNWKKYSAGISMDFKLTDIHGKVLNRKAHNHDHIRIDMPAQAGGFDWVAIEALEYDDYPDMDIETFAMRVRPGNDPANKQDSTAIGDATSTIVIERIGKKLIASYHGRNESSKNSNAQQEHNTTENAFWLGLSDTEWAKLIKGLID